MSETARSADADSVLSSIRRLAREDAGGTSAAPARGRGDCLILTPALRVVTSGPPLRLDPGLRADIPDPAPAPAADPDDAATLEQRIAELEAIMAGVEDEWEPDGSEALRAATAWARERAAPAPESAAETPPPRDEDEAAFVALDASVLQEEMIRDLVADIVREELHGPLGDRITRNVRKLVRREINRALAERDIG